MNFTLSKEVKDKAIVNKGNVSKIVAAFEKAEKGEKISVAFLGGSITQGCHAETQKESYAYRTFMWFKEKFKNVEYINAGVGATGSVIGVHRAEKQVLSLNPDIIFIDFAVNDKEDEYFKEAYESLIRKILLLKKVPGIIEVFMSNEDFSNTQNQQIEIGKKYNVSMISYRDILKAEIEKGNFKWNDVAADEVHPNNNGHYILMQFLTNFLEEVYNEKINYHKKLVLGEPLYGEKYLNGSIINNKNTKVLKNYGFVDDEEGFQVFNDGWKFIKSEIKEGQLDVEIEAKNIFILYRKSIKEEAGNLQIKVDNKDEINLSCLFKDGWGDYAETEVLLESKKLSKHNIEIKASGKEVYIMGFLIS